MDEREAYIALNMMDDIGPVTVRSLVAALGSARAIFEAEKGELGLALGKGARLVNIILKQRDRIRVDLELERAGKLGVRLLTRADSDYPEPLSHIHDPPLALYMLGSLEAKDKQAMAVVGSRRATRYGRDSAELLSFQIARVGFTVVSGLARGIDTAAHRGALKAGGRSIAVLGGAIDSIYPPENKGLAEELAEHGAVLSEFPFGRQPDKTTFPMRNRIVSGLSMGVLVVEAGLTSGALITAGQALDQGRSVFAVPGRIDSPASMGAHRLLKEGARLVESVDDILAEYEYLFPSSASKAARHQPERRLELSREEQAVIKALEDGELDVDSLIRATGVKAAAMGALLLGLEMKRAVRMLPGRVVEAVRNV